jgi:hypothetical protein
MTNEVRTQAVVASGLVPEGMLRQFQKWGTLPPGDLTPKARSLTPEQLKELFQLALEQDESVLIKDTDLDIVKHYVEAQQKGRLYVTNVRDGKPRTSYVDVYFCRTLLGEYVLPWQGEQLGDLLLAETTYLKPTGGERVYFADVRDLYFGDQKAFVVCQPAVVKEDPTDG